MSFWKAKWWKIVGSLLLIYVVIAGFLMEVPRLPILNESIRNLHFHVPMWFGMFIVLFIAFIYSILYLYRSKLSDDLIAAELTRVGIMFGILGLLTGSIWAKYTWGSWWSGDIKQNMSAITVLLYCAYWVLRASFQEDNDEGRGRIAAVWNIFSFCAMIPLIFIIPKMYDSLHPSNGGNEGFVVYDQLDNSLRFVFYPAVIGWTIVGLWLASQRIRLQQLIYRKDGLLDD
ncbi:cytochrome c biogenesis protein [Chitinophagales bacterium]|nr:cytochrome c biogenesis protein [Chitinophagales bacterium]